jgi:hypothetical protein
MDPSALLVQGTRAYFALKARMKAVRQLQTGQQYVRLPENAQFGQGLNNVK